MQKKTTIHLALPNDASPRIQFGTQILERALTENGYDVKRASSAWSLNNYRDTEGLKLSIGSRTESTFIQELETSEVLLYHTRPPDDEGYYIASLPGNLTVVAGGGDSGVLYGCLELADLIQESGELPFDLALLDGPMMKIRGPAIGLQKTKVEPPRRTYEWPVTPNRFPWFYDKALWLDFLDMLLEQRCNIVYIWSGHPFSSFVKLPEYPEAIEVTEEEFRLNQDMLRWLTEEADKRGIWIVIKFYNIHIPLPFARKHGLDLHQPKPLPLTSDYYIKSISAFIQSFPNVGLMVCLGEALNGGLYGVEWFRDTILVGVNDALEKMNVKEAPPIIVRAHAIPAHKVMDAAGPHYPNLYTEAKFNGESLTTYTPRGKNQRIHQHLSKLHSIHIFNVHILANLEPFRYGSPSFIQKCVQAARDRLGANGIHLYPLFYWDWPYAPDKTMPRLRQMDRDWIWFAAWFRYAWNPDLTSRLERKYWIEQLADRFGSAEAGEAILDAYEHAGEIAPKLIRRFGITEGNRQTMSLGMLMSQLTNPGRYNVLKDLWESQSPEGERLDTYVQREVNGEPHIGETPIDVIESVEYHAKKAEEAIQKAKHAVIKNTDEFERLTNDIRAISLMTHAYTYKVRAAINILTYKEKAGFEFTKHVDLLERALPDFRKSLESYRELAALTKETYLYANSMQTPQRKIPFPDGEKHGHWVQCLPYYEAEYEHFVRRVKELKSGQLPELLEGVEDGIKPYEQADFTLLSDEAETYTVDLQTPLFMNRRMVSSDAAEELIGLTGIRINQEEAADREVSVELEIKEPAKVLVGFFRSRGAGWAQLPTLEENTHADERGGLSPILKSAVRVMFTPKIDVHAFTYEPGNHTLAFGKGAYVILGVIKADQKIKFRNLDGADDIKTLDWLFE